MAVLSLALSFINGKRAMEIVGHSDDCAALPANSRTVAGRIRGPVPRISQHP
jgi:hypothetical protein